MSSDNNSIINSTLLLPFESVSAITAELEPKKKEEEEEANCDHLESMQQPQVEPSLNPIETAASTILTPMAAAVAVAIQDLRDQIYCSGSLLEAVQNAKLFGDCKHFVDMPLKRDARE